MPFTDEEARKEYARQHYLDNKAAYAERRKRARREREQHVFDLKAAGSCVDCGQQYHPCQMQYDHIGTDKIASVSDLIRNATLAKVVAEIAKCELVCANCHSMRTWLRKITP